MLVGSPAFDYVRFTSFHDEAKQFFIDALLSMPHDGIQEGQVMQYFGLRSSDAFTGTGKQAGKLHHLFQVSGDSSHAVVYDFSKRGYRDRCTRIDIQLTMPRPEDYSARGLFDALSAAAWPHHKRKLKLVEGEDGFDTVYIGSRESGRYIRIYVKEGENAEKYVRFEIEFKGDLANSVYGRFARLRLPILGDVLQEEFYRLPALTCPYWQDLEQLLIEYEGWRVQQPKHVHDDDKTLTWLGSAVQPSIERLLKGHNRSKVENLIRNWYDLLNEDDPKT